MKKIISIVALATALCASAFAYEDGNRDAEGNIVRGPYVRNGFFDNTFIELQGGLNFMASTHMGMTSGWKSIYPAAAVDFNLGKWFNPNFGARLGWQGLQTRYYPARMSQIGDPVQKAFYSYLHGDFMVNVSNWWSGYKETRVWDFVPYAHLGWIYTPVPAFESPLNKLGAGVGLYNKIRLTDRLGLSLDLRATFASNQILGTEFIKWYEEFYQRTKFGQKIGGVGSALIGLHVNLGKTGWVREANQDGNLAAGLAGAGAAGLVIGEYIGAAKKDEKLQGLQKDAEEQTAAAADAYAKAANEYNEASKYVDANGFVTPAVYGDIDPELAAAYADMANFEDCPDFTTMSKAEKAAWDKSHKDILPADWKKMSDEQKNAWVRGNIYDPAQVALDNKNAAAAAVNDAVEAQKAACKTADDALALAQWFVDDAAKRVDSNGNILPATYPNVDPATAQKYADLVNSEAQPDFTKMSKKEQRAWNKAHKDILPSNWKKMTPEQKNDWLTDNVYGPAYQAKADAEAAAAELARAQANKAAADKALEDALKSLDQAAVSPEAGVGFFTIGKSEFNEKQLANWKKSIKTLDKAADYTVTGYADNETGSAVINQRLRKERSEYVANLLKENGFTGTITATPSDAKGKFVNYPIWKNRSAQIKVAE